MRTLILTFIATTLLSICIYGQVPVFSENFEANSMPDSVSFSGTGTWGNSSMLSSEGSRSDSLRIATSNDSVLMSTYSFSTTGNSFVLLQFDHICKIEYWDEAYIEISTNNGNSWTRLTGSQYLGTGQFGIHGNKFTSAAYPTDWMAGQFAQPDNTWWKGEVFDISMLAGNASNVMVRFVLRDANGGNVLPDNYAWFIDEIRVIAGISELNPPQLSWSAPFLPDTVYTTGPFLLNVTITDASGIDTAYLVYTVNGGIPDTIGLTQLFGPLYSVTIPSYTYNSLICYHIVAVDGSAMHNQATIPIVGCKNLQILQGPNYHIIGNGNNLNSATSYPAPYGNFYQGAKHQFLIRASELAAAGLIPGPIISLGFDVVTAQGIPLEGFTIKIGHTSLVSVSYIFATNLTTVYSVASYTETPGWNSHNFQTPFFWNGSDNIMIETCFNNSGISNNATVRQTPTSFASAIWYNADINTVCATGTGNTGYQRPNIRLATPVINHNHDAGASQFLSPLGIVLANNNLPVSLQIKNYGIDTLKKVNIHLAINGVVNSITPWTGTMLHGVTSNPISLGTINLPIGPHTLKGWTSAPNDSLDQDPLNDTTSVSIYSCDQILNGSYTIGGFGADFPDINSALDALINCGISGPVEFLITTGTYSGQWEFHDIPGITAVNTVTFRSASGNPEDVVLLRSTGATTNYTILMNGAKHFKFKQITVKSTNATFGRVIEFASNCQQIQIDSCIIDAPLSTTNTSAPIYSGTSSEFNISITNSTLQGGYYGVYYASTAGGVKMGLKLINNKIKNYHYYGIYTNYTDSIMIVGNYLTNSTSSGILYPIYISFTNGYGVISKNTIISTGSGTHYGLTIANKQINATDTLLVSNNFISQSGNPTGSVYGILNNNSSYVNYYNNSVRINGGSASGGRVFYLLSGANIRVLNNIFSNNGGGYAYYISVPTALTLSDYNNLYTSGTNLAYHTSAHTTFALYQAASGKDVHSHNISPPFKGLHNLALSNTILSAKAIPLMIVPDDIFGKPRTSTPTIGAHEIDWIPNDAGVITFTAPTSQSSIIEGASVIPIVTIQNFGSSTLTSIGVNYCVNNGTPLTYTYSGALLPFQTIAVSLPAFISPAGIINLCAFTVLPNDSNTFNDSTCMSYYATPLADAAIVRIKPVQEGCSLGQDSIKIVIKNNGAAAIPGGYHIAYRLSGSQVIVSQLVNSAIAINDSIHLTFNTLADFTTNVDSLFVVHAWVSVPGDVAFNNDSTSLDVLSLAALPAPIVSDTTIPYATNATLHAISPNPLEWFSASTSTVQIGAGAWFTTPILFDTTTYWVQANASTLSGVLQATTTMAGGNAFRGNMFDITPNTTINIDSFDVNIDQGSGVIEIYYRPGSYIGYQTTSSGWIMVGSANVTGMGAGIPTRVPIGGITLQANQTYGLYITQTTGNMNFTNITHGLLQTEPDFTLMFGHGGGYPFNASGAGRQWNGTIYYSKGTKGCKSNMTPITVNISGIPPYDVAIAEIKVKEGCAVYSEPVTIKIGNNGTDTLKGGVLASYRVNNNPWVTTETIPDTIMPGGYIYYTFSSLANLAAPLNADTMYSITAWISLTADINKTNDTLVLDSIWSLKTPPMPSVVSPVNVAYGSSAVLSATSPLHLEWYGSETSHLLLGTGSPFTTPMLYDTTTYWVHAGILGGAPGSLNIGTQTSDFAATQTMGFHFTAPINMTITGLKIPSTVVPGGQYIQVVKFNSYPMSYPTGSPFTTLAYITNRPFGINQVVNIPIQSGDEIGIIGGCNSTGNTINTSYGQSLVPSSIGGLPVVLSRILSQNSLVSGQVNTGAILLDSTSPIGRIEFQYETASSGCTSLRAPAQVNTGNPPPIDAGIELVENPTGNSPSNVPHEIRVRLKNYGLDTLHSVNISWMINNVAQGILPWAGSLPHGATLLIVLDTMSFSGGTFCLKAWTSMPNGIVDLVNSNDTSNVCINICLNGILSIGPQSTGSWNYTSFTSAINALINHGICGPVVFEVQPGIYQEQISLYDIPGIDSINTVTFRGFTGDSTSAVLQYAASSATANWTVRFSNASWFRFEKMTIKATGLSYGRAIVFSDHSPYNVISNCVVEVPVGGSNTIVPIYSASTSLDHHNKFLRNRILNGYYGLHWHGMNASNLVQGTLIEGNHFEGWSYIGAFIQYQDSMVFKGNIIRNLTAFANGYGLYAGYCHNANVITENRVELEPANEFGTNSGLHFHNCTGTSQKRGLIANNFVSISGTNMACLNNGILLNNTNNQDVLFNNVNLTSGSTVSRGIVLTSGVGNNIKNNYSRNGSGGFAYYVSSSLAINESNFNNYHTSGNTLAYWGGNCNDLSALKLASLQESNSLNLLIPFVSITDLHILSSNLSRKGQFSQRVPNDIDGLTRSWKPTIGAHEVPIVPIDAGISAILSPPLTANEGQQYPVEVTLTNYGFDTLYVIPIEYAVNSGAPVSGVYNGVLPSQASVNVILPSMISPAGNATICAKTVLPLDSNSFNDEYCQNFLGSPAFDAQAIQITGLADGCNIGLDTISVMIRNSGANPINAPNPTIFTASYQINGSQPIVTQAITQVILPGDTLIFNFSTLANLISSNTDSIFNIVAWLNLQNDNLKQNDTVKITVKSKRVPSSPIVPASNLTPYGTHTTLTAISPSNDTVLWYNSPTGGAFFNMGNTWTTPTLYSNATYYVEALSASLQTFHLGIDTMTNSTTSYPTPYGNWYWGSREQYIIRASELTSLGMAAGEISELAFNVASPGGMGLNGFTISMGHTSQTEATDNFISTGLTTVYSTGTHSEVAGWNPHVFQTPFNWDGSSNVVIDVCFNNTNYSYNGVVYHSFTSFPSVSYYHADNTNICSYHFANNYYRRPNMRFKAGEIGCPSQRVPLYVSVSSPVACDLGVSIISEPNSAIGLTNQVSVKVHIDNFGTSPQSNFQVSYRVNNSPIVTENINTTLPANGYLDYTFVTKANLSVPGTTYVIKAWTSLACDATHQNDTTVKSVTNMLSAYCISSATNPINTEITNVTLHTMNNSSICNGALYTNHSTTVPPPSLMKGLSYPMSITSSFAPGSSAQNVTWVRAWIDFDRNGFFDITSELVFSKLTSSSNTVSATIQIPATALAGNTMMRVVLNQTGIGSNVIPCGTYTYGETEDYIVSIFPASTCDAGVVEIMKLNPTAPASTPTPLWLKVMNMGLNAIPNGDLTVAYQLNNNPLVTAIFPATLASGAIDSIQMPNITYISGNNTLCAYTIMNCDTNSFNDEICSGIYGVTLPYFDDFESKNIWYSPAGSANWQYGTPTGNIINNPYSGTKTWSTNLAGSYYDNSDEYLYTPVFSFAGLGSTDTITLSFYHWLATAPGDFGRIQYSTNGGQIWSNLGFMGDGNGFNWYNIQSGGVHYFNFTNSGWMYSSMKLNPGIFNSQTSVQFRFHFSSNSLGNSDGWSIDNFRLALPTVGNDIGVVQINVPVNDTAAGSLVNANVSVTNFGTNTQTSFPVQLRLDGSLVATEIWTGTLSPNDTVTYSFNTPYTVPNTSYILCAKTQLTNDAFMMNDENCRTYGSLPAYIDVGIKTIKQPAYGSGDICYYDPQTQPWYQFPMLVQIKNHGQYMQTTIPLKYSFYAGGPVYVDIWTGFLASGDTIDFLLNNLFLPNPGLQQVCIETDLPGDAVPLNNQYCKNFTGVVCTGIDEPANRTFLLYQNVPNPTRRSTTISYQIPNDGKIELRLLNMVGQQLLTIVQESTSGYHSIELDLGDLAQGVYYYSITYNNQPLTRKLIISR
jgi:hypothetical protein